MNEARGRRPATDADVALYERQGLGGAVGFGERPALLLVDFTNAFADPDRFGGGNVTEAIANTVPLLRAAREARLPIAFTRVVYAEDGSDAESSRARRRGCSPSPTTRRGARSSRRWRRSRAST